MNPRLALPIVAAATFLAGFGVAELTGVRAIGGLVLVAGGFWCGRIALRIAGPVATALLLIVAVALFVAAHPLGRAIGAWPAVLVTASLVAGAAAALAAPRLGAPASPSR